MYVLISVGHYKAMPKNSQITNFGSKLNHVF